MAIAFNNAADGGNVATASSFSFSYTCSSGSSRLLVVPVLGDATSDLITGVTYNSIAMQLVWKQRISGISRWQYFFYLINPAAGSHTVAITASSACDFILAGAADYTGVQQNSQPNVVLNDAKGSAGTSWTSTFTTTVDNDWAILVETGFSASNPPGAGTGATRRAFDGAFGTWGIFDSGGVLTPPAAYSMTTTRPSSANDIGHMILAFKPDTGAVSNANAINMTNTNVTVTGSSVSFSGVAIGPSYTDRLVFIAINGHDGNSTGKFPSAVTIDGISAAQVADTNVSSASDTSWWWTADSSANLTATIAVTLSGSTNAGVSISVFNVTGANTTTPVSAAVVDNSGSASASITIPANGLLLAASSDDSSNNSSTLSWTNATTASFQTFNPSSWTSLGSAVSFSSGTPTVTATWTGVSPVHKLLSMVALQSPVVIAAVQIVGIQGLTSAEW